jgi:benzoate membrane transport protein
MYRDRISLTLAAVVAGFGYIALGALAGITATVVTRSPPVLIEAVAGLALIGALGGALFAAVKEEADRLPAVVTFLIVASPAWTDRAE